MLRNLADSLRWVAAAALPRWLTRRRSFLRNARGVLPDQADAVVFLRTVSAPAER